MRTATTLAVLMLTMMAFTVQTAWAENEPFTANLENFAVSSFLENVTYTEDKPSQVTQYIGISSGRLDHPNYVSITVPENNAALTVTVSHDAGYSNPETFTFAAGTTLCKIYNLVPQKIYYYKVEAGDEILKQGQFTTEGHLRMIMTETGFNIRDLGGWATVDEDNRTAYGKLFRGGELNYGHTVSAADLAELRRLGIGAELDLRRNAECNNTEPTASALVDNDDYFYMNQGYDNLTLGNATNKENIKRAFEWVLGKLRDDKAVYFHCRIGADRTGMYALVFGGLCGMTFDQLCKDYELTSFSEAGTRQWDSNGDNTLKTNLNYIKAQPGNTLQMKFYNYMYREVGVSASDLMDYIRLMTDGEPSIRNSNLAFNNKDGEYISSLSDITALCAAESEPVKKAQLSDGTTTTDLDMSIDGIIITFSGVDLEPNKEYTLTIPAGAIEKGGIENAASETLTFNTSAEVTIRTWAGLKAAVETATTENPVSIELEGDITRNVDEAITVTGKVTLDLNGKKIDGNNKNFSIFVVDTSGDLTITDLSDDKDGEISGAHGSANIYITETGKVTLAAGTIGGTIVGVSINMSGSFTMNGGTINTGNSITGFGVELLNNSSFTMNGGTITGNNTGVNIVSSSATMTVSGNVNISGNTSRNVNLIWDGSLNDNQGGFTPIQIGGKLKPSARIGVCTDLDADNANSKAFTNGLKLEQEEGALGSVSNFFVSGRSDLAIVANGNELGFAKGTALTVNDAGGSQNYWCSYYNSEKNMRVNSQDVTVYKAKLNGTTSVTLTEVFSNTDDYGVIGAGNAVLIHSKNGDVLNLTETDDGANGDYNGNELHGTDSNADQEPGLNHYVINKPDASSDFGFYKLEDGVELRAHEAYLIVEPSSAASLGFLGLRETNLEVETATNGSIAFYGDMSCTGDPITTAAAGSTVYIKATPQTGYDCGLADANGKVSFIKVEKTVKSGVAQTRGTDLGSFIDVYATTTPGVFSFTMPNDEDIKVKATAVFPKAVTVTAQAASKFVGEDDPTLTATVEGVVGTDKINYTISRAAGETPGEYAITVTGEAVQGNYVVTFVNGAKLTITAKPGDINLDGKVNVADIVKAISDGRSQDEINAIVKIIMNKK